MQPVIRDDDGELLGHVDECDGTWRALTVFGGVLGAHASAEGAETQVRNDGLASMADRWTLNGPGTVDEIVCIVEANAVEVSVSIGYYALAGSPRVTIPTDELRSGTWSLTR